MTDSLIRNKTFIAEENIIDIMILKFKKIDQVIDIYIYINIYIAEPCCSLLIFFIFLYLLVFLGNNINSGEIIKKFTIIIVIKV